jgi:hypothetical protein
VRCSWADRDASVAVEAFIGPGEQPAGPVERIVLAASMPHGVVLDPAAALIQLLVGDANHINGSAIWTASGSMVMLSNTARFGPDRSNVAQAMFARHSSERPASHRQGSTESLPGTTSNSTPASTSTIDVDQRWRRRDPSRTNSVSSKPKAVG